MVRRLIQNQNMGVAEGDFSKGHTALLTSREMAVFDGVGMTFQTVTTEQISY